ncbi:MAG: helicase-related protein, partial [Solirubrobacteraceae bacterium]
MPRDKRDRWGRLAVHRRYKGADGTGTAELELCVLTFPARGFTQRRLGSAPREEQYARPSAVMDLGEAVQTAIDAGVPLLLSTEAAGQLKDTVRVGRMKGRPGMLTITTSDGVSATTRRLVAEQATAELRALKRARAKVTLAAGARQVVRMTMARPLADDPVLLGRQREMAALKVVGSGVDASAVGTGKTISSGRALAHRASTQPRFRGLIVAEGRLLGQWREELAFGAPGRGLPPLAPNLELLVVSDDRQIAGQIRRFDRELGDRAGVVLARAQGVVLGNVGVFVDASVDPETLTHFKATLATALVRQGLVADAVRGGGDGLPLLRGVTAQTLAGVAGEEQVIVFGERVWCLRQLARTLRERHGVEARVADGSITTGEFEVLKRRFTAGEFPVLCLSRIGHEGHNLQNASVLCHLDLPWLPSGLEHFVVRTRLTQSVRHRRVVRGAEMERGTECERAGGLNEPDGEVRRWASASGG